MAQASSNSLDNPYQPMASQSTTAAELRARSVNTWASVGMLAFAIIPILFGIYSLVREQIYAASLPPGTAACGNMAIFVTFIIGVPAFAFVGAVTGWLAAKLWPT